MRNGLLITGWEFLYRPSASESPFMTYVNAPLTPAGRLRVGLRHLDDRIPKSHVAAEFCVSRSAVITWAARYLGSDEGGFSTGPRHRLRSRRPQRWWSASIPYARKGSGRPSAFGTNCPLTLAKRQVILVE